MAAGPLLKYIYNTGSEEVIRRGKRIFLQGGVHMVKRDELSGQLTFKVRNDIYYNQYIVTISKYQDEHQLTVRCTCPYNMGELCRHETAALFHLNDLLMTRALEPAHARFDQRHTVVRMKVIDVKALRLYTSEQIFEQAQQLNRSVSARILQAANEEVDAEYMVEGDPYTLRLKRHDDKRMDTSCTCTEQRHALCVHKTALFLQLLHHHGPRYFDTILNRDHQKNKLLALYGYSLADNLEGKFEFTEQDGRPVLRVLDPAIKKVNTGGFRETAAPELPAPTPVSLPVNTAGKRLGLVIRSQDQRFPYVELEMIEGEPGGDGGFTGAIQVVDVSKYINLDQYPPGDRDLPALLRKVLQSEQDRYMARTSDFGEIWSNIIHPKEGLTPANQQLILEYLHPRLLKLLGHMGEQNPIYFLPRGKTLKSSSLQRVFYAGAQGRLRVHVRREMPGQIRVNLSVDTPDGEYAIGQNQIPNPLLWIFDQQLYLMPETQEVINLQQLMQTNLVNDNAWPAFLKTVLIPMRRHLPVRMDPEFMEQRQTLTPVCRIYLGEQGSYFLLQPVFLYGETEVPWNEEEVIYAQEGTKLICLPRHQEKEQAFIQLLKGLHTHIRVQEDTYRLALHAQHALKKNWFFLFFDKMEEEGIQVLGLEGLQQFRISRSKPQTRLSVSAELDWFDARIEVMFDGVNVKAADIQKALSVKQNYVPLGNGSYGLLPEEWLQKYSLLFKMADTQGQQLRINKYNFNVIDELHEWIDDEELRRDLLQKKERLLETRTEAFEQIPVPEQVQATLRPYQLAGFRWLVYLNQVQWGGLLADDMGLGKTLQALTFLQYLKNEQGRLFALVVCPTTLLYNWEAEIRKFTPDLSYHIHHGPQRDTENWEPGFAEVILTTYGTLRSDISALMKLPFDYVVLDESQTIKNPVSQVARAAQLLKCGNRLALSGTPMQNNTFDLFAQMHFLNPGMLGSKEFFRESFAKPVDRFQDEETKEHLRKLVYPFMLRRTKEQVAADLPEKTEITLLCEMGPEQRMVYENYRQAYRSQILGTIDQMGIERSRFAILQGLMKLRQICDSPAIIPDQGLENHSIKLDELVRELRENTGDHKVLVFSQFLGMLALIRKELEKTGIPFEYFDGSFTAQQRDKAIREFQENDACKVFLISLKAGGMGLNLTAADYVYLVDPWWNPAVEQQAIDRTHRIGQTKNIFAYRLICKDTVEEKMMLLKDKKNQLVRDIISDDQSMVKQLSREDVAYLFS